MLAEKAADFGCKRRFIDAHTDRGNYWAHRVRRIAGYSGWQLYDHHYGHLRQHLAKYHGQRNGNEIRVWHLPKSPTASDG
jgi:hypothetical protein